MKHRLNMTDLKKKIQEKSVDQLSKYLSKDEQKLLLHTDSLIRVGKKKSHTALFEGKVEKYKPGFAKNLFVERYLQVTSTSVHLYKDELGAACWDLNPLT